jgi:DNA-binding MarR family transcriptional regulator/N-acetylglutamate synthase-like GNAT family acetyltransferase
MARRRRAVEPGAIEAVRRFNRFYTARIGALGRSHLGSGFNLVQVRIMYEIASRDAPTASELCRDLGLDPGYVSRLLRQLERAGLVARKRSAGDRRRVVLRLTARGKRVFASLDRRAREDVAALLAPLNGPTRNELVEAMGTMLRTLAPEETGPIVFRDPRPGDLGWVVHRHGILYAQEYGWNEHFEALVARIVADFVTNREPERERCWIAERDGVILGSVFLVKHSPTVGKLRLLLVEPSARGTGLGTRLVQMCIDFARHAGYRKLILWTNDVLHDARRIYEREGFRLTKSEPHSMFGAPLVSQTWELPLTPVTSRNKGHVHSRKR